MSFNNLVGRKPLWEHVMKAACFVLCLNAFFPLAASAQCVGLPECQVANVRLSDWGSNELRLRPVSRGEKFWERVTIGTTFTNPSRPPFASGEVLPWPSTDFWQPRTSVRAEFAVYNDPGPEGFRVSLGYVRGSRIPGLPRDRGTAGVIVKIPVPWLDLHP